MNSIRFDPIKYACQINNLEEGKDYTVSKFNNTVIFTFSHKPKAELLANELCKKADTTPNSTQLPSLVKSDETYEVHIGE